MRLQPLPRLAEVKGGNDGDAAGLLRVAANERAKQDRSIADNIPTRAVSTATHRNGFVGANFRSI